MALVYLVAFPHLPGISICFPQKGHLWSCPCPASEAARQVKTTIGFGSPNKADSHDAHGAPLGADEAEATRKQLGWNYGEFEARESLERCGGGGVGGTPVPGA